MSCGEAASAAQRGLAGADLDGDLSAEHRHDELRPHGTERAAILTVYQPYRVTLRRVHWYDPNDLEAVWKIGD